MSASDHLSSLQFKDYPDGTMGHRVEAVDKDGEVVGSLQFVRPAPEGEYQRRPVGTILKAIVHPDHQRKGVATEMLRRAREIEPAVHHDEHHLSEMGRAWATARP
jgi:GNAT superfamily N-acetyltransferase